MVSRSTVDIAKLLSVEVEAESLYEAAALGIRAFRRHGCEPRGLAKLDVEMRSSVTHSLTVKRLEEWLGGAGRSPREAVLKERLREMVKPA